MRQRGRPPHPGVLTPREAEVVKLVAKGLTNREVAELLKISEQGVRYHLNQVYSKLAIDGREALASWHNSGSPPPRWAGMAAFGLSRAAIATAAFSSTVLMGALFIGLWRDNGPLPEAPCAIDSAIIPAGLPVTCYARPDMLPPSVSETRSVLIQPPPDRRAILTQVAVVDGPQGSSIYLRYNIDGVQLELLEGPVLVPLSAVIPQGDPLMVGDPPQFGWFEHRDTGAVLWWCPFPDSSVAVELHDYDLCPGRFAFVATGLSRADLATLVFDLSLSPSVSAGGPTPIDAGAAIASRPTPVPYPTPKGERIVPKLPSIPAPAGAVEVDGFMKTGRYTAGECAQAVQRFETTALLEEVFPFYQAALEYLGFTSYHGGGSVAGRAMDFTRNGEIDWVTVSSLYIRRPEDADLQPPPGFQGKSVPFADRFDGKSYFWIITATCP